MQKEQIGDFTRRLSLCNRGEMIVIIYDIYFAHIADAKSAFADGVHEQFKDAIHKAQRVLTRLIEDLNFTYAISMDLYRLYVYARNELSRALYENRMDGVEAADSVMKGLYTGFAEAAKQDDSAPLMQNTQQVYAGMTYGRGSLTENLAESNYNRGFLA